MFSSAFKEMTLKMLYDDDLFGTYFTNYHANCFDNNVGNSGDCLTVKSCDDTCKKYQICALLHGQSYDQFHRCLSCDAFHWNDDNNDDFNHDDLIYDDDAITTAVNDDESSSSYDSNMKKYMSYLSDPSGCSNEGYQSDVINDDDEWWNEWWWGTKHDITTKKGRIGIKSLLAFIIVFIFCLSAYMGLKSYYDRESRIQRLAKSFNEEKHQSWGIRYDLVKHDKDKSVASPTRLWMENKSSLWANNNSASSSPSSSSKYSETSSLLGSSSYPSSSSKQSSLNPTMNGNDEETDSDDELLI